MNYHEIPERGPVASGQSIGQSSRRVFRGALKSVAILDDKALLAVGTYIDLNPVAAGIADTPEASKHTFPQPICAVRRSFWIELNALGLSLLERAIDAAGIRAAKNEPE